MRVHNLNNESAIEVIVQEVANIRTKHEDIASMFVLPCEQLEFKVTYNMLEESNRRYTLTCTIECNDEVESVILIGEKYFNRGILIKAKQLMKLLETSKELQLAMGEKNFLRSWGWERQHVTDLLIDVC